MRHILDIVTLKLNAGRLPDGPIIADKSPARNSPLTDFNMVRLPYYLAADMQQKYFFKNVTL